MVQAPYWTLTFEKLSEDREAKREALFTRILKDAGEMSLL